MQVQANHLTYVIYINENQLIKNMYNTLTLL